MTDGGILYRWREDQRKYAPASVMHALVREESGIARDWWEPVCTLAEYLGVELREPDDKIDVALVREYVANSASWRGTVDTPLSNAARAAAMWLRAQDQKCRHWKNGMRCWGMHLPHHPWHESDNEVWVTFDIGDEIV